MPLPSNGHSLAANLSSKEKSSVRYYMPIKTLHSNKAISVGGLARRPIFKLAGGEYREYYRAVRPGGSKTEQAWSKKFSLWVRTDKVNPWCDRKSLPGKPFLLNPGHGHQDCGSPTRSPIVWTYGQKAA